MDEQTDGARFATSLIVLAIGQAEKAWIAEVDFFQPKLVQSARYRNKRSPQLLFRM